MAKRADFLELSSKKYACSAALCPMSKIAKIAKSLHPIIMYLQEPYPDIHFYINLRRKTLFYVVNLIIPCVGISFLSGTSPQLCQPIRRETLIF